MKAERKLISFIGLGSGSVALPIYSYIHDHPEVFVPDKDTRFFSEVKVFAKGIDWYEGNFSDCKQGQVCGELSSSYLENLHSAGLIAKAYPSAKLLVVIDNPVLMIKISYLEAKKSKLISDDVSPALFLKRYPEVLTRFRFGQKLTQYFSFYSHRDMLVLMGSEILSDRLRYIAVVYEHIGIDKNFVPLVLKSLVPIEEEDPKHRPWIIKRFFRFIFKVIKEIYKKVLKKLKPPETLPEKIIIDADKITLTPELENYLKDYYRSDVIILSSLLHRDMVEEWSF